MNRQVAIRWWPAVGFLALTSLGVVVGKGSTALDDWFLAIGDAHPWVYDLLLFTDGRLVILVFAGTIVAALARKQWRLAAAAAITPVVAVAAVRLLKRIFGREKLGALAYPSGHVTVTVIVLSMLVLVAGAAVWMFVAASVLALVGLLGQAFTYHYFTDTIGALFLATSLLCLAARLAKLDRCQPRCDLDHSAR